jgi:hypothetical protein
MAGSSSDRMDRHAGPEQHGKVRVPETMESDGLAYAGALDLESESYGQGIGPDHGAVDRRKDEIVWILTDPEPEPHGRLLFAMAAELVDETGGQLDCAPAPVRLGLLEAECAV